MAIQDRHAVRVIAAQTRSSAIVRRRDRIILGVMVVILLTIRHTGKYLQVLGGVQDL
ncbi:MAG: hypothetical protein ACOYNN_07640 [Terrimicrobiaceae bacterium]